MPKPAILWFRQDLRLADNPALHAVADRPILPVYILDPGAAGAWAEGGASRWLDSWWAGRVPLGIRMPSCVVQRTAPNSSGSCVAMLLVRH